MELGVGTGRIALPFIEAGVRFTGFDISEKMVERLREKLGGDLRQAQLLLQDITQPLPLPDQSQDAVLAVHILHLVDAAAVLGNIRRVMKPGGALVWGFEESPPNDPHRMLRERFHAEAAALGYRRRDYHVQEGRQLLAEWGAYASQHIVATWTEEESLADHLARLQGRVLSSTWNMTDEMISQVAERTTAWALESFGDLDQVRVSERRFVIDWYVLGGT